MKYEAAASVGVLAIAGGKGGTGKTTVALALARAFAAGHESGDVLAVDADVDMPDLHAMAGVPRKPTVLDDDDGRQVPELAGVRVAPAPPADARTAFRERLRSLCANASTTLPRVVVDAPCGAGPDAALALDAARGVVLVTRPTPAAVRDTAKTAAMARALETPVVAVAVVGSTPSQSLERVFDVDDVVPLPLVEGDPLASPAHASATRALAKAVSTWRTPF